MRVCECVHTGYLQLQLHLNFMRSCAVASNPALSAAYQFSYSLGSAPQAIYNSPAAAFLANFNPHLPQLAILFEPSLKVVVIAGAILILITKIKESDDLP